MVFLYPLPAPSDGVLPQCYGGGYPLPEIINENNCCSIQQMHILPTPPPPSSALMDYSVPLCYPWPWVSCHSIPLSIWHSIFWHWICYRASLYCIIYLPWTCLISNLNKNKIPPPWPALLWYCDLSTCSPTTPPPSPSLIPQHSFIHTWYFFSMSDYFQRGDQDEIWHTYQQLTSDNTTTSISYANRMKIASHMPINTF